VIGRPSTPVTPSHPQKAYIAFSLLDIYVAMSNKDLKNLAKERVHS